MATLEPLLKRQGDVRRHDVYLDPQKKLKVGMGHLVTAADKLKVGDTIDDTRISTFLQADSAKAMRAAQAQATKAKITDQNFILMLACVNFQLGPTWFMISKYKKLWELMLKKKYKEAAAEVGKLSEWRSQSPRRAKEFQLALLKLKGGSAATPGTPAATAAAPAPGKK